MNTAVEELNGLLSDGWFGAAKDYYHRTLLSESSDGQNVTALHSLVGQRVRGDAVRNFLAHHQEHQEHLAAAESSTTTSSRSRNNEKDWALHHESLAPASSLLLKQTTGGVTALHIALQRNSWDVVEIVRLLLEAAPELAGIPMNCMVYPLHLVCFHYYEEPTGINKNELLNLILAACPGAANAQTSNGDTPLSLLFSNKRLMRLCYSRQEDARTICNRKESELYLRDAALHIARAALPADRTLSWLTLCGLPRCPPLFLEMLLVLAEEDKETETAQDLGDWWQPNPATGRLPLHAAASAQAMIGNHLTMSKADYCMEELVEQLPSPTLLEVVLEVDRTAAAKYDQKGRLPLHEAVVNTTLAPASVLKLAIAHSAALAVQDPVSGLYPALAAASAASANKEDFAVYELLRMNPSVCSFHMDCK